MSRSKMQPIDGTKLKGLLEAAGHKLPDISEECGYNRDYMASAIKANQLPRHMISLIGLKYNIPEALYAIPEEEPEPEAEEPTVARETEDDPVLAILQQINRNLIEIKNNLKGASHEDFEQKVFNLPFSDPVADPCNDRDRTDQPVSF